MEWEDVTYHQSGGQKRTMVFRFEDGSAFATEYLPGKYRVTVKKLGNFSRYVLPEVTTMEECQAAALMYYRLE